MTIATDRLDQLAIDTIRTLSIDAVQKANSGHPGAPMGMAPMAYALWTRFLRHAPTRPDWPNRDRFVLSAGHASDAALLAAPPDRLRPDARRPRAVPPVGLAHARAIPEYGLTAGRRGDDRAARPGLRQRRRAWPSPSAGWRPSSTGRATSSSTTATYAICSRRRPPGGDRVRGRVAGRPPPARQARSYLYDDNHIQLDGPTGHGLLARTSSSASTPTAGTPQRVEDGNDLAAIDGRDRGGAGGRPAEPDRRPDPHRLRRARTSRTPRRPTARRSARTRSAAPRRPTAGTRTARSSSRTRRSRLFRAADPARRGARRRVGRRASTRYAADVSRPRRAELERRLDGDAARRLGRRPQDLRRSARTSPPARRARRRSRPSPRPLPELFGGAADLSESNLTDVKGGGRLRGRTTAGRNLRFGVREHAMGGIANGIAYHGGFIPYAAHVPDFSDYMRGSVRLAALSGLHVDLRLDPRLGRPRRGRPDPPAGRALRGAAGDPEPVVHAARRRQRDRRGLGASPSSGATARSPCRSPARSCRRCAGHGRAGPRRRAARRLRPARGLGRRGRQAPDLILIAHRLGAAAGGRRRPRRSRPRASGRRVVSACRAGSCSRPRTRPTARRSCRRPSASASRSRPASPFGWERYAGDEGAIIGIDHFGASAPGGDDLRGISASPPTRRRRRPARSSATGCAAASRPWTRPPAGRASRPATRHAGGRRRCASHFAADHAGAELKAELLARLAPARPRADRPRRRRLATRTTTTRTTPGASARRSWTAGPTAAS